MSGDRSTRNALAAVLLVAALFVAMNRAVSGAPLIDWWLPLLLVVLGGFLALSSQISWRRGTLVEAVTAEDADETAPRLPATIHNYEAGEYAAPVLEAVLPFADAAAEARTTPKETPVSPETPAPAIEPEPQQDVPPMSPETPAPAAEPEPKPVPMSPETPTPDVPTEVLSEGPSQRMPLDRTVDTGQPAPELSYTAHTEYADPDKAVAKREAPPAPKPDESGTATDHSEPEKIVVEEKTAGPEQRYETEKIGEITPERAERVMNGDSSDAPLVTEAASARVTAQEVNGEGSVGSGDDLTKLDGIGPKIAAALRAAGIDSFQKLANSSNDALRDAVNNAGVRLIGEVDTWAYQASYAARGDWQGLENFNRERKAARKS